MIQAIPYIALRVVGKFLSLFPLALERKLFSLLWPIYRSTHHKEMVRVHDHLEKSGIRPLPSIRLVYENLFLNGLDSLRYLAKNKDMEARVHMVNRSILQNQLNSGVPTVVVSIHSGAFEMMHRALCHFGRPVNLVASHHHRPFADRWLRKVRSEKNLRMYRPDEAPKLLREFIRRKGILAMMLDQSRSGKGNVVELLGRPTYLWMRIAQEANRMGAAVVTMRVIRKGGMHVLRFENAYPPETPAEELSRKITLEVERWIIENPEQWTWNYPRLWKTES